MSNEWKTIPTRLKILRHQLYEAASKKDHNKLSKLLRNNQFDVINNEDLGKSALDVAASRGDYIAVELLLAHGAIPDYKRPKHVWTKSTLSRAILSGNLKVIQLLVNQGCDPDTELDDFSENKPKIPETICFNYWYKIVQSKNLPIFQLLLKCKGRKIANDKWSQNMLLLACCLDSLAIIRFLLDQGVSIESTDDNGWTSLFYGLLNENTFVIDLLLDRGANINHKDFKGYSALHIGVLYQKRLIKSLINRGADINATDINGLTPINMAFSEKPTGVVIIWTLLMYQDKIDLAKPDINGVTPLHRVVFAHSILLFRCILYALDVDINAKDNMGKTPLQSVNNSTFTFNILFLLQFGANSKDLYYYSENGWLENVDFLNMLEMYTILRSVANLSNDIIIDTILADKCVLSGERRDNLIVECSNEIKRMKETMLCDKLTFYDFLHAKKRTFIKVAKNPGMHEMFTKNTHEFDTYQFMLCKNYLSGARPLTSIESKALNNVEENLDVIFKNKLPNLVTYNIKKYIDIEDMIILDKINTI